MSDNINKLRIWFLILILLISIFISLNSNAISQNRSKYSEIIHNNYMVQTKDRDATILPRNAGFENEINTIIDEYNFNFTYELMSYEYYGQSWDLIRVDGCYNNVIPWQPQVPVRPLIIETEYEISDIRLDFSVPIELSNLNLAPAPEPEVLSPLDLNSELYNDHWDDNYVSEGSSTLLIDKINDYTSSDRYYPDYNYIKTKLDSYTLNGIKRNLYSIQIYPCKYNPGEGHANLYLRVSLKLFYNSLTESLVSREIPISDMESTSTKMGLDEVNYLILTNDELIDELELLSAWKMRKGIITEIVDVTTIYDNDTFDGYDKAEELRNFIRYAHNEWETEYVLLAGDWDTIPTRMCQDPDPYSGADDGEIPSDSYYACISEGSTWDVDNDHIYGELGDLDDIIPDLIVSRIAINSEIKMSDWVEEVINYECSPPFENWTNKVILLGPNVHNSGDGAKQSEYFYNKYLKFIYESFDKFYEDSEDGNKQFSRSELFKSINSGCTFINYLGHGSPTTWTYNYGYSKLLDRSDVNRFTNKGMKPVVYAMSCLTSWFDNPSDSGYGNFGDCIGETFTENVVDGGIGYIGSSRTSVGIINQKYGPFATGMQEDYVNQLSQYNFGLGSSYTEAKKSYAQNFGHIFDDKNSNGEIQACWLEVNLLGEPELTLWTAKPQKFYVTNSSDDDTLRITVKNDTGYPIKNAKTVLQTVNPKGEIGDLQVKYTSSNGEAVFHITGLPEKINLTITKTNFIPHLELVTIADLIPPITKYEISPGTPDGESGWYVTTPIINLTRNEESNTYYRWNDGDTDIYFEPISVPEGDSRFYFYSVDLSNNIEEEQMVRIKVDLTAPSCELILKPNEPDGRHDWYIIQPTINFTYDINTTVYFSFDSEINITFSEPILAPIGIHKLQYYTRDIAGNLGETCSRTLKVDITPPDTEIQISPSTPSGMNGWYNTKPTISFTTENGAETYYSLVELGKEPESEQLFFYEEPFICPEGILDLRYYSIDYSGCQEDVNLQRLKIDTISPSVDYKIDPFLPDGENGYYVSDVTIDLFSELNATIYYHWDDETAKPYSGTLEGFEGVHTLTSYSIDLAGNLGESVRVQLKIDTEKPHSSLIINPTTPTGDNNWYITLPIIEFRSEPYAKVYYRFEETINLEAPMQLELPEGITKLYYHSVDKAGNIENENMEIFKIDVTPPIAKIETDQSFYKIGSIISFKVSDSSDNNDIKSYYVDFGDGTDTGWMTSNVIKHHYDDPGRYEIILLVRDEAGLENDFEESIIIEIKDEERVQQEFFTLDNVSLIVTLIIAIFIVLSILNVFYFKTLKTTTSYRQFDLRPEITLEKGLRKSSKYKKKRFGTDIGFSQAQEAIVIDKPVVFKMMKVKCPGCQTIFLSDDSSLDIRCPKCGLCGELPDTLDTLDNDIDELTNQKRSQYASTTNSKMHLDNNLQKKKAKFICPECKCLFKTSIIDDMIECPNCGVKGRV